MKLYRGNLIGTDWNVRVVADGFYILNGCTVFYNLSIETNNEVALYPTERLVITDITETPDYENYC